MSTNAITVQVATLDAAIGRRVKNLMLDHDVQNVAVTRAGRMEPSAYSRRLKGKQGWDQEHLLRTAYVLNVSPLYLQGVIAGPISLTDFEATAIRSMFPNLPKLPGLDSNQEPIGSRLAPITQLADHPRKPATDLTPPVAGNAVVIQLRQA